MAYQIGSVIDDALLQTRRRLSRASAAGNKMALSLNLAYNHDKMGRFFGRHNVDTGRRLSRHCRPETRSSGHHRSSTNDRSFGEQIALCAAIRQETICFAWYA